MKFVTYLLLSFLLVISFAKATTLDEQFSGAQNLFSGDTKGFFAGECGVVLEKAFDEEMGEVIIAKVYGRKFLKTFTRNYASNIVLDESGEALVFISRANLQMEHLRANQDHSFNLYTGIPGDAMVRLSLHLEQQRFGETGEKVTYSLTDFSVVAGRATKVETCKNLN